MAWEPPMSPVIASCQMTRTRPDGVQTTITVEIGTPLPVPPEVNISGYYCTLRILGVAGLPEMHTLFGGDSIQALTCAITFPGSLFSALPYAREIDFSGLPNFGFPYMPNQPPIRRIHAVPRDG